MLGLDPSIHASARTSATALRNVSGAMDPRVKPEGDKLEA